VKTHDTAKYTYKFVAVSSKVSFLHFQEVLVDLYPAVCSGFLLSALSVFGNPVILF
jgi:uncharacterized protein involved in response to NO